MSDVLRIQVRIEAAPEKVYRALMEPDALRAWFAEDAAVTPTQYGFWGRFTPGVPDRATGQHPILINEPSKCLQYGWRFGDSESTIRFDLIPQEKYTLVLLTQEAQGEGTTYLAEDFWFLSLENLRRYVEGKRCDMRADFTEPLTGEIHVSIEIDAPASEVYQTLIKPEQLQRWIASNATVELVVGGKYDFGWGFGSMKILELKENERFAYDWGEGDSETVVTWSLEGSGGKTRLTLVHSGFAADHNTDALKRGWSNFMNWIRSLVEEGETWLPPIKELDASQIAYYPDLIGRHQHHLAFK